MITLPEKKSDDGVEARVLLAECRGPAASSYTIELAAEAMQLMDAVLWNRMANPGPYMAKGAKTLADIVRAPKQFEGFGKYPDYDPKIRQRIQDAIDIANNPKDSRQAAYAEFVNKAIEIAKSAYFTDPSPGTLASWRTANSGSPGKNFTLYKTLLGNDYYYV
ncbi:MAG: hypothetical protein RLZZ618_2019 [Pseudomonadota bacterium]|jgi:hypothetical protein